jgi:hypothetical protein
MGHFFKKAPLFQNCIFIIYALSSFVNKNGTKSYKFNMDRKKTLVPPVAITHYEFFYINRFPGVPFLIASHKCEK